jgi:dTDP-4-amino-4,6-dideoxygalactose transaminase
MMKDARLLTVRQATTVRQAMQMLDATGSTVLLLVGDDGRFVRTVTDGDLRRLLIGGGGLESTLASLPAHRSTTTRDAEDAAGALALMNGKLIDQLPVIDGEGRPVGVFLRRDLDVQILLSTPHMGQHEIAFIESAFRSNWIAPLGPNVDAFETELAQLVCIGHAAAVSSGTAAIHLALRLLGVGSGDVVFCSSLTFVATANPILYQGAAPVFIDSEPSSWNMSPDALARALADAAKRRKLPKAVIVVNLYGQSADMDPLLALCAKYDVPLLEDAAESLGATYKGRASGTLGRLGIFSFNGNKIITTSGGGMIVSDDRALMEKARFLATQARDPAPYYQHSELGYNYRMSNVLAGIGRGQLKVLNDRVAMRRTIFERYQAGLADVRGLGWMPEASFGRSTRWLTIGTLEPESGIGPTDLIASLEREKIEARRVWKPMHLQPLFAGCAYYAHAPDRSIADDLFNRGVCLPSGSNMTPEQQARIVRVLRETLGAATTSLS